MRTISYKLILLSSIFLACNNKESNKNIIGTWKLKNVNNQSQFDVLDKTTFHKNGKINYHLTVNGKTEDSLLGKYTVSNDQKFVTIKLDTFPELRFEIIRLTKDLLELKEEGQKHSSIFSRYED